MGLKKYWILMMLCGCVAGCASNRGWLAPEGDDPKGATITGSYSEKVHVVAARLISRRFSRRAGELPAIAVLVTNRGNEAFEVSSDSIQAFADLALVKIYKANEYVGFLQREGEMDRLAAQTRALGMIRSALPGEGGAPTKTLISARLDAASHLAEIKHRHMRQLSETSQMLYPKMVAPGESFGGVIRMDAKPLLAGQKLRLRVLAGSETHEFIFVIAH